MHETEMAIQKSCTFFKLPKKTGKVEGRWVLDDEHGLPSKKPPYIDSPPLPLPKQDTHITFEKWYKHITNKKKTQFCSGYNLYV